MNILRKLINAIEAEDASTINEQERKVRYCLQLFYRLCSSIFLVWILFDFLFSSIWIHGYVWTLNLPLDRDLSDLAAGLVVEYQENIVGKTERVVHAISSTIAITILLICCGFANGTNRNVKELVKISANVGMITGFIRSLQMKNRLFSCLHEGFYCYFITFLVGMLMTMQTSKVAENIIEKKETKAETEDVRYDENNNNIQKESLVS